MDHLADAGSGWTCGAMHAAGLLTLEMQTCGSKTSRFVIGLVTIAVVTLIIGVAMINVAVGRTR